MKVYVDERTLRYGLPALPDAHNRILRSAKCVAKNADRRPL